MKSKASTDKTVVSLDLNIKTIAWAKELRLDLSDMAYRLLKSEVKSMKLRSKEEEYKERESRGKNRLKSTGVNSY